MTKEKVLLVVVDEGKKNDWTAEDEAQELEELVNGCRGEVVKTITCRLPQPNATFYIGSGKVEEIASVCRAGGVDTVVFSHDLKGSQQRNLEEEFKVKTIDRTQLILDIFARHATSLEGKMQVELAQLQYLLPRLVGKSPELSRQAGGIGTLGPGETKLEIDRRRIGERISRLQHDLKEVAADRSLKRKRRREQAVPQVSLVGYTNAGKSTLMNTLTHADQVTKDSLFTTLDSLSRQFVLPNHQKIIFSDTVGFMHDLPHKLIEAFKATLEEVVESDLLLLVLDISHPNFQNRYQAVLTVLKEIGAGEKPIITVLNKIDKVEDKQQVADIACHFEKPVLISAKTGESVNILIGVVEEELSATMVRVDVLLPTNRMDLVNLAHKEGQVISVEYVGLNNNVQTVPPNKMGEVFDKKKTD